MTQSEKLQALIEKAIDGGWAIPIGVPEGFVPTFKVLAKAHLILFNYTNPDASPYDLEKPGVGSFTTATETVIFNHDFAKALLGEIQTGIKFIKGLYNEQPIYNWQDHLKEAVISSNPIDYLYKAVFPNGE